MSIFVESVWSLQLFPALCSALTLSAMAMTVMMAMLAMVIMMITIDMSPKNDMWGTE